MHTHASLSYTKTSRTTRGKSQGWTAFDLKQRQKQGLQPEGGEDPYPPLQTTPTSVDPCGNLLRNNIIAARSFTSVLLPSANFPALTGNINSTILKPVGDFSGNKVSEESNHNFALNKLKELHGWADYSLIEDVMATADNDINKASTLLKGMVFTDDTEEKQTTKYNPTCDDFRWDKKTDKIDLLVKTTDSAADIADLRSTLGDALKDNNTESRVVDTSCGQSLSDAAAANMKLILQHLRSIPVEPEWEEDDVYLSHRKNALRMIRSASQHSRAATNAFVRGDHFSAQQHSLKAQEEWLAAEQLNLKAANEILNIRNSKNDAWKLDLHGLHAAEAVLALQEHLLKIETQFPMNQPISANRVEQKNGTLCSLSLDSFNSMDVENWDEQQSAFRQRRTSLQVITGVGNHSQGQAALPTAVRSFLNENGYRFEETRPGMITVWPKFRHR